MSSLRPSAASLALLALAPLAAAATLKVPGQFATIGEAVAAAAAGDTISVAKGVYVEQVVVGVEGLKLTGSGAVIDAEYGGICLDIQADGVSVKGFTFANGLTGLFALGADVSVLNCRARACADAGFSVQSGPCKISGNSATGCGLVGILFTRGFPGDVLIHKNTCEENGGDGIGVTGDGVTLSKNRCERNAGEGLRVTVEAFRRGDVPPGPPVTIEKNDCLDNADGLLVINGSSSNVIIQKNDFSENDGSGLVADAVELSILSNTCNDNGGDGLQLFAGAGFLDGNQALRNRGNGIATLGAGGIFGNGSDNVLSSNVCKDNGRDGIVLGAGNGNTLDGNTCKANGDDGIDLDDVDVTATGLTGNACSENGHEGIDNSGQATAMTDNVCKKNGFGIGPDIAGTGDGGVGTVATFTGNSFGTGGEDSPSRLDDYSSTAP